MIVDASALVAILFHEPKAERLLTAMQNVPSASLGAPTPVEAGIVIGSRIKLWVKGPGTAFGSLGS